MFRNALLDMIVDADTHKNNTPGAVFTLGEEAHDEAFRVLLRQSIKQLFANGAIVKMSWVNKFSPDPAFAGERVIAASKWRSKQWERARQGRRHTSDDEL